MSVLALHPGRITERLVAANKEVQSGWLDSDLNSTLAEDISEFHRAVVRGQTDLVDTHIGAMSEDEAVALAQRLLELESRLEEASRGAQRTNNKAVGLGNVVARLRRQRRS